MKMRKKKYSVQYYHPRLFKWVQCYSTDDLKDAESIRDMQIKLMDEEDYKVKIIEN